jgi:hypothetical protein
LLPNEKAQWLLAMNRSIIEVSRRETSSCLATPDSSPLQRMLSSAFLSSAEISSGE